MRQSRKGGKLMQIAAVKFLQMIIQKLIPQVLQQQLQQTVWILKKY